MLTQGKTCKCLLQDTCPYSGREWCHRLTAKGRGTTTSQEQPPNTARCLYRERPGCCWVLAAVETLASDYLVRHKIQRPPVPSELITAFDNSSNIEVRLVPLKAHHGAVWRLKGEWVIQLNARESRRARRYTMFHEAFHIAYRIASPSFNEVELSRQPFSEVLADHFATCLLMPKKWVEELWPGVRDVRALAGIFDVPVGKMRKRLGQLGLLGGAANSV